MKKWAKRISIILISIIIFLLLVSFYIKATSINTILKRERSFNKILTDVEYSQEFAKNSQDQWIDMWWIENQDAEDVVLYMHGDSGRFTQFIPELSKNHSVLAPTYPGFGLSEGSANEENVLENGLLAYDWLKSKGYQDKNIIIWGHSFGGSTSTYLASQRPNAQKLVLVNTFSSVYSLCQKSYSFLCYSVKDLFDSSAYAQNVILPVRQFHVKTDKVISYDEGKQLFENFASQDKKFTDLSIYTHSYFDIGETLK